MRTRLPGLLAAVLLAAPVAAEPVAGTCRVTALTVIARSIGLAFPVGGAVGFEFPTTVDAAAGTIALDRTGWIPIAFTTLGIAASLDLDRTVVGGTIDAAGNVILPGFRSTFTTHFCTPACDLVVDATMASGFQETSFAGTVYPTRGAALDFGTGEVTLEGHVPLPDAPGGGSTSGLRLACVLDPIPAPAGLPAAAALVRARGKVKLGPPLPETAPAESPPGDKVVLEARLRPGARALDPSRDLFVTFARADGAELATLLVPGGTLQGGRTLKAADEGGATILVLSGRKESEVTKAALRGTIRVKSGRKGLALRLVHQGLDLTALGGSATIRVQIGDEAGLRPVSAKTGRKATTFR